MVEGPLSELKIIEFGEMVSGPVCGKLFTGMGAEVIKIERPGSGDEARRHPPFPGDIPHPEKSGLFLYLNTGKKSITLDPSHRTGARIFKALIADADILIENHQPGYMGNLGLSYEELSAINPRLIYSSISPFGQTGPYRDWKGSDLNTWAMSLTGYNTPSYVPDLEKENPLRAPGREADMMAGLTAAAATMVAVFHRFATGVGQWIDAPAWIAMNMTARLEMAVHSYTNVPFTRFKEQTGDNAGPPYRSKDGWIYPVWSKDSHWRALKALLKHPPALESEIFDTVEGRGRYLDDLSPIVAEEYRKFDSEYLVTEGQRLGLPIGPVYTAAQAAEHPHLGARSAFVEVDHPIAGQFKYPGESVKMSETPAVTTRAPLLGEHNEEILCGRLGYSKEDLCVMRAAGIA